MSTPSRLDIPGEGKLLVAFSGGSDSLYLLFRLSLVARERTVALYVDHNIRGREELEKEIALNRRNAEHLGIPLVIKTIPKGEVEKRAREKACGTEASARELRYRILRSYAEEEGFAAILTAHHHEDQLETILMRVLDGSPFWTWGGIQKKDGLVLRPMLSVGKEEILRTLEENGLEYASDSTNSDLGYKRNYIRRKVVPELSPTVRKQLLTIAENVQACNRTMRSIAFQRGFWCEFKTTEFLSAFPQEQEKLVFDIASHLGGKERLSRSFVQEIVEKAARQSGRLEGGGLVFYFSPERTKVYRRIQEFSVSYLGENTQLSEGFVVDLNLDSPLTLRIPEEFLEGSVLRTSRSGDRIELCSGSRHVSDFGKEYRHPQSLVLEQNGVVVALLNSAFGGRDRLFAPALGKKGQKVSVILRNKLN